MLCDRRVGPSSSESSDASRVVAAPALLAEREAPPYYYYDYDYDYDYYYCY